MAHDIKVTCADCGCDTGASNFTSVQRRLNDGMTAVWQESGCRKKPQVCNCHLTTSDLRHRTASGLPTEVSFKVQVF
jgi:hypothetical protein